MDNKHLELLASLDRANALIQTSLHYCKDQYDRERLDELQVLMGKLYAMSFSLGPMTVLRELRRDLGHATPKVGVEAAIFDDSDRILLIRRSDDRLWALPGGWVEVNERLADAIGREVQEETGLEVQVGRPLALGSRLAGEFCRPHSACFIVFLCRVARGVPTTSQEAVDIGFFNPCEIHEWHKDHCNRALLALNRYLHCSDELPWT